MARSSVLIGFVSSVVPAIAAAQGAGVEADRLFREGRAALDRRDYARACTAFAESQRLDPGAGTLLNLAECRERLGDVAAAHEHSREAEKQLSATGDDRAAIARSNVQRLEPRIARVAVRVDALAPAGTRVAMDGRDLSIAELSQPLVVNPGRHAVTIRRPGLQDENVAFALAAGETRDLVVGPEERPAADGGAPWLAFAVGGVGVVGLGVAAVTGIVLLNKRSVVTDPQHCDEGRCDEAGLDAADGGDTLLVVNAIAWGVGVVGIGAGVTLFVIGRRETQVRATAGPGWMSVSGGF